MAMGKVAWKIMGTGGAILAGVIATKVIDAIWARAGQDEINPKNPHAPLAKAVAYAAITGLAVGAARTIATRKAAAFYEKSSGHLPAEVRDDPV
jgi:hypothetical protein